MFTRQQGEPDLEYFTIYDSKTKSYKEPSLAINRHDLIRQITNMFADPDQAKNRFLVNAEDFSIFKVGEFDRKTGQITACKHEHIANMHDIRAAVRAKGTSLMDSGSASEPQGH